MIEFEGSRSVYRRQQLEKNRGVIRKKGNATHEDGATEEDRRLSATRKRSSVWQ
jgi:hypothetical protein